MNSAPVFITGGVVGAGGSAPVPGPGAGEVPGVVGVGAVGALDGVAELDVDVSELDVTPPQFPSTITEQRNETTTQQTNGCVLTSLGEHVVLKEGPTKLAVKMARLSASVGLCHGIIRELPRAAEKKNAQLGFPLLFWISTASVDCTEADSIDQSLGAAGRCPIEYRSSRMIVRR